MMKKFLIVLSVVLMLAAPAARADLMTKDNRPSVNASGNLSNCGHMFTDGRYMFAYYSKYGYLKRLDSDLEYETTIQDSVVTDARYSIVGSDVYFVGRKKPGLYKMTLDDGEVAVEPKRIINANILNYAANENGVYYAVTEQKGVWRADPDGANRKKLANHQVHHKNNVVRMAVFEDRLYYINHEDHCLYVVPCDGSEKAQKVSSVKMHYFVMGMYHGKPMILFVRYAKTDELGQARIGVIDESGEKIEELDYITKITSRYINYMGGYLYYSDSDEHGYLKRVRLDASAPQSETLVKEKVGYITAYDGWVVAVGIDDVSYHFIELDTMNYKRLKQ